MLHILLFLLQATGFSVVSANASDSPVTLQAARIVVGQSDYTLVAEAQTQTPISQILVRIHYVGADGTIRGFYGQTVDLTPATTQEISVGWRHTSFPIAPGDQLIVLVVAADRWRLDSSRARDIVLNNVRY